jgi:hypothetical protein
MHRRASIFLIILRLSGEGGPKLSQFYFLLPQVRLLVALVIGSKFNELDKELSSDAVVSMASGTLDVYATDEVLVRGRAIRMYMFGCCGPLSTLVAPLKNGSGGGGGRRSTPRESSLTPRRFERPADGARAAPVPRQWPS